MENINTGVQLEPGLSITQVCKSCNAKIIFTGGEPPDWVFLNRCPQCGVAYEAFEVHESSFLLTLDDCQRQLLRLRNIQTVDDKGLKSLHSTFLTLIDKLAMLQLDHKKWHSCLCRDCNWTGYNPKLISSGLNAGKGFCPKCQSLKIEAIPGRD